MGRLAVCVDWPYANIPWVFMHSLWNSDVRRESDVFLVRGVSPSPDLSGNMMFKKALELGADEILACCCDQTVPSDILARFRSYNKPVVGALTPTRQDGHKWIVFDFDAFGSPRQVEPSQPLQRVDMIGGCALFKAEVFRKVPPPWFVTETSDDGCEMKASSDVYFYRKCKQHGVEVYIDATVESKHLHSVLLDARSCGKQARFLEVHHVHAR